LSFCDWLLSFSEPEGTHKVIGDNIFPSNHSHLTEVSQVAVAGNQNPCIPLERSLNEKSHFVPIVLTADDVPDSHLPKPNVEDNLVKSLCRWLKLRGISSRGNKNELVER
jgi:hypothetical protein